VHGLAFIASFWRFWGRVVFIKRASLFWELRKFEIGLRKRYHINNYKNSSTTLFDNVHLGLTLDGATELFFPLSRRMASSLHPSSKCVLFGTVELSFCTLSHCADFTHIILHSYVK